MTDKRVLKKIKELETQLLELEEQLQELKLEVKTNAKKKSDRLEVGQRVRILNPRAGQENNGVVCKVNYATKRATVKTNKGKVSRIFSNLEKE